jgi:hypothetical protein
VCEKRISFRKRVSAFSRVASEWRSRSWLSIYAFCSISCRKRSVAWAEIGVP